MTGFRVIDKVTEVTSSGISRVPPRVLKVAEVDV
jgi:hypothetical protein